MTDRPTINPQIFAKRGAQPVPRLDTIQVPSFRQTPSVNAIADAGVADMYVNMADDAKRLQAVQANQFQFYQGAYERNLEEVQTLQQIEARKIRNQVMLQSEQAIEEIRQNVQDAEEIPQATIDAYRKVKENIVGNASLSAYQQKYLEPHMDDLEVSFAKGALNYQKEVRIAEAEFALTEQEQAYGIMVSRNPNILTDPEERDKLFSQVDEDIELFGKGLTQLDKAKLRDKIRESLAITGIKAQINNSPGQAKQLINTFVSEFGITADQAIQLEDMADRAIERNIAKSERYQRERLKVADDALRDRVLQSMFDPSAPELTNQDFLNHQGTPEAAIAMHKLLIQDANAVGNAKETVNMLSKIRQASKTGATVPDSEIDNLLNSPLPISPAQYKTLKDANKESMGPVIDSWLETVSKLPQFKEGPGSLSFVQLQEVIRQRVLELREKGVDPVSNFTPGHGNYIGDELIKSFTPTIQEKAEFNMQAMGISVDTPENPFEGVTYLKEGVNEASVRDVADKYFKGNTEAALREMAAQGLVKR